MKVTGQCHCGKIAFEAEVDPERVGLCHCTDCQRLSGTAYRTVVPAQSYTLLRGSPKHYVKTADSGRERIQAFCPDCGTPLYAVNPDGRTNRALRWGAINERAALQPKRAIWCASSVPWAMTVAGLERVERQPG